MAEQDTSTVVEQTRTYYNSGDADNFYFHIWGGEDIHIGLYDSPDEDISSASRRTVQTMAQQLRTLDKNSEVLDLGAGYGGSARYLVEAYGCHVHCLNLSEVQNQRNRELNRQAGLEARITVVDGSFEAIDYAAQRFDVVWSQDSILHSGYKSKVFHEVDRVLKPGGEFIFSDPMQTEKADTQVLKPVLERILLDSMGSIELYRKFAEELGWETVEVIELPQYLKIHYSRVREELRRKRSELLQHCSEEYLDKMEEGLDHWVKAGEDGYLNWGILHFQKK